MKYHLIYFMFFVVTASIVWNELRKTSSHEHFFHKVETFMEAGGRNTAQHGYELCVEINHLKAEYYHHHEQPFMAKSCAEIYGLDPEEVLKIDPPHNHYIEVPDGN